jgi:hypothetical protein
MGQVYKLTKLLSTHTVVDKGASGRIFFDPTVGEKFVMVSNSENQPSDFEIITTTTVEEVNNLGSGVVEFRTVNSKYRLETVSL